MELIIAIHKRRIKDHRPADMVIGAFAKSFDIGLNIIREPIAAQQSEKAEAELSTITGSCSTLIVEKTCGGTNA